MEQGVYKVQVLVEGKFIPFYQYNNLNDARIVVIIVELILNRILKLLI